MTFLIGQLLKNIAGIFVQNAVATSAAIRATGALNLPIRLRNINFQLLTMSIAVARFLFHYILSGGRSGSSAVSDAEHLPKESR